MNLADIELEIEELESQFFKLNKIQPFNISNMGELQNKILELKTLNPNGTSNPSGALVHAPERDFTRKLILFEMEDAGIDIEMVHLFLAIDHLPEYKYTKEEE